MGKISNIFSMINSAKNITIKPNLERALRNFIFWYIFNMTLLLTHACGSKEIKSLKEFQFYLNKA